MSLLSEIKKEGPSREFYRILGVCFNAGYAVFLEIYRQTDRQKCTTSHSRTAPTQGALL